MNKKLLIEQDDTERFYHLLFEPTERICWAPDVYGVTLYGREEWNRNRGSNFFSINPLLVGRIDANVTCFRNILIEFDSIPLAEQEKIIETMPKSTVVFSGNKSYHIIISLQTPCETRQEYDKLARRIFAKLPNADKSTKNPSRLSRAPNAEREAGLNVTVKQYILFLGTRVSRQELDAWLGPEEIKPKVHIRNSTVVHRILSGRTVYFLAFGAPEGTWNMNLFMSTLDMARAAYEEDEIMERLEAITGHLDKKDLATINSALKAARQEQE